MKELQIKSKSKVHERIESLMKKGLIKKYPYYARGIEILRVPEYLKEYLKNAEKESQSEEKCFTSVL